MTTAETEIQQLLAGMAALEEQRPVLGDAVVDASVATLRAKLVALQAAAQPEQQRKLATVLFADVSGFTTLSETMDAEVLAEILNDLWALVDKAVTDHGGRVDKHIGDAVMALWGAEAAREDDPERAVRGALAMQAAIAAFCQSHNVPMAMRVGVNTGPVLLGWVGSAGEYTAMGDAVNLAKRLESAAPVGEILISYDTYRHVRGIFDVAALEPIQVKGKAEPVQTYLVRQAKPRAFRMATRGVEGVETRMIGREAELLALQSAYEDAMVEAETRVVTISGEAGVGKSRLLYEFDDWLELRPEEVYYFKGRGTPNTHNVPHSLFRDLFAFRFDIRDSDPTAVALDKFRAGMTGVLAPELADVVGHWLGFDFAASDAVSRLLGASGFAETARAYLTRYFGTLAAAEPVVIFLEDIHWADDQSLDLVVHLTQAVPAAYLLVVAAARPMFFERRPNWGEGEAAFQQIQLKPLSRRSSRTLVDEILQRVDDIPDSLRDLIVDSAEGNPFYVEELVKMLIEQGVIERGAADLRGLKKTSEASPWRVRADRLVNVRVPTTLIGLLQARLDGLPRPEREALQRASVVGRLFWDECVAELLGAPTEKVGPTLAAVRERELIFRRENSTFAGAGEYIFKHALLRDVAYETVLLKHRAAFHGKVGRWLESHAGERLGEYLSLIAEHYIQAGEGSRAAGLLERSAADELAVGNPLPAREALERALALREEAGETGGVEVMRAAIALGGTCYRLGDFPAAEAVLERGLAEARVLGDMAAEAEALASLGMCALDRGHFDRARTLAEAALAMGKAGGGRALAAALRVAGYAALTSGELEAAELYFQALLEGSRASGDVGRETAALNDLGNVATIRRDLALADRYMLESLALARRAKNLQWECNALGNLGSIAYARGDYRAAYDYARESQAMARQLGFQFLVHTSLINLTQAEIKLGDLIAARATADEALSLGRKSGSELAITWAVYLYGQLLHALGDSDRGLALFGLARAQPALEDQLRVEMDEELARLDLPAEQIAAGLAAGAALDMATVVEEILAGKW